MLQLRQLEKIHMAARDIAQSEKRKRPNQYRKSHLMQKVQFDGKELRSPEKYSIAALRAETK